MARKSRPAPAGRDFGAVSIFLRRCQWAHVSFNLGALCLGRRGTRRFDLRVQFWRSHAEFYRSLFDSVRDYGLKEFRVCAGVNLYDPQIVFVRFGRDLLYFVRLLILDINDSLPALVQPTEQHELINNAGFKRAHDRRFDRFIQERVTR